MKKVLKICSNCLVCFLVICVLVLFVISLDSNDNGVSKIGSYSLLDVNGDSMYPYIKDGDLIVVDRNIKDKYDIGDTVTFVSVRENKRYLITHDIIDVISYDDSYKYVTKGVNNGENDPFLLDHNEIIGEYKGTRIPVLGYVVRFSRTTIGYWLLVVFPLGFITVIAVYELIKEVSKIKEEG